jgi:hypothetical protein
MLRSSVAFVALLIISAPAIGEETACRPAGQITRVSNPDAVVLSRGSGEVVPARRYTSLYSGDRIRVTTPADRVEIIEQSGSSRRVIGLDDGEVTVAGGSCDTSRQWQDVALTVAGSMDDIFAQPPVTVPSLTVVRDGLKLQLLLNPADAYLIPASISEAMIPWRGYPATASARFEDTQIATATSVSDPFVVLPLAGYDGVGSRLHVDLVPEPVDGISIAGTSFDVEVTDISALPQPFSVPEPNFDPLNLNQSDFATYATWLYLKGGSEWQLTALTLLNRASEYDFAARRLLVDHFSR